MKRFICTIAVAIILSFSTGALGATPDQVDRARVKGLAWLIANQNGDGSWKSAPGLDVQSTATAIDAFRNAGINHGYSYGTAVSWLGNADASSVDSLARKIISLKGVGENVLPLLWLLQSIQNRPDRAVWGAYKGYATSFPDTPLALSAFRIGLFSSTQEQIHDSIYCDILPSQNYGGSWSYVAGPASSQLSLSSAGAILPTAHIILELQAYKILKNADIGACASDNNSYGLINAINNGTAWLLGKRNADNGFGDNGKSSVIETALAYKVLAAVNPTHLATEAALDYLVAHQDSAGSWRGDPLQTALVLESIPLPAIPLVDSDNDGIPDAIEAVFNANPYVADSRWLAKGNGQSVAGTLTVNQWGSLGPEEGLIQALAVDPTNQSIVYAGTYAGGVYKTIDAGQHWERVNTGLPDWANIIAIAVDATGTVYAAETRDVYRSVNGGASWMLVFPGNGNSIGSLAIDSRQAWGTVYVAKNYGDIWKTNDGGETWSSLTPLELAPYEHGTTISIDTEGRVYAKTQRGVQISSDGGATWALKNNGLPNFSSASSAPSISYLVCDSYQSDTAYAIVNLAGGLPALYRTTNGGANWWRMYELPQGSVVKAVAADPAGIIYAAAEGKVYQLQQPRVQPWGWFDEVINDQSAIFLALASDSTNAVYVGGYTGIYKKTDQLNWQKVTTGLKNSVVIALAIDPADSKSLIAATSENLLRTSDGGVTWLPVSLPEAQLVPFHTFESIAFDSGALGTAYAISGKTVLKSTDSGAHWSPVFSIAQGYFINVTVGHWNTSSEVYANAWGRLYKSIDGGLNWTDLHLTNTSKFAIGRGTTDAATTVYTSISGVAGGILKSNDGGLNWHSANSGLPWVCGDDSCGYNTVQSLAIDPRNPAVAYAVTSGLYKTIDGGATWVVQPGLPTGSVWSIVIDPTGNTIYIVSDTGLYKSADDGATWSLIGVSREAITDLFIDPSNANSIYGITYGHGVVHNE
jgi:photosystem II stability/assembly factor-like uncharacterized protein